MFRLLFALLLLGGGAAAQPCPAPWDPASSREFWHRSQGSQMIRSAWMAQLKQPNGTPFMADGLARFGYIADPPGLPIGFSESTDKTGERWLGMTCAACHTRALALDGRTCLIEGGPALADFQTFARELRQAMAEIQSDQPGWADFARALLPANASPNAAAALSNQIEGWQRDFVYWTDIIPADDASRWGPGRMDAVAMIFKRVIGLDIGNPRDPAQSIAITADAPVRYPFLWNASNQDHTQWTRFAQNSAPFFALMRNLGEVYGVFALFEPVDQAPAPIDYLTRNSADFDGLARLEELVRDIPTPAWGDYWPAGSPRGIDPARADRGSAVFASACASCHGLRVVATWPQLAWETGPPQDRTESNTDTRARDLLRTATGHTGVVEGESLVLGGRLGKVAPAIEILTQLVSASYTQHKSRNTAGPQLAAKDAEPKLRPFATVDSSFAYEARVLRGIWAAAPYLHNGSVPTLAALLQPAALRPASFLVGPNFDPVAVGLASEQPAGAFRYVTTGCDDKSSGRSRCGHEWGVDLSDSAKSDLLEYLKQVQ